MKRGEILVGLVVLGTMLGWVTGSSAAVQAAAPTADRVSALPQIATLSGPRVESALMNRTLGYTLVLQQVKKPPVSTSVQRTLPANDTVLFFTISWRHGERQLSGLLHAFRHGTQLHLAVHQKVYLSDRAGAAGAVHRQLVSFGLEGTVSGVRTDAKGFLIGTRVKVDFNAGLPGDLFGSRLILEGPLSIRRIGL